MKKIIILVCVVLLLISCGSNFKVKKKDLVALDANFKGKYSNFSNNNKTMLSLIESTQQNVDSVKIKFDASGNLILTYDFVLGGKRDVVCKGKFKRNFYEVYFKKDKFNIPFIYSKYNVNRVRFYLKKDTTLVVEKYYDYSGNIFLFAGGSSSSTNYFFEKL